MEITKIRYRDLDRKLHKLDQQQWGRLNRRINDVLDELHISATVKSGTTLKADPYIIREGVDRKEF